MKKTISLFLAFLLVFSFPTAMTYANEKNSLTKDNISTLNELELLDELLD